MKTNWIAAALLALPLIVIAQLPPANSRPVPERNPFEHRPRLTEQAPLAGLDDSGTTTLPWQNRFTNVITLQARETVDLKRKISALEQRVDALEAKLNSLQPPTHANP